MQGQQLAKAILAEINQFRSNPRNYAVKLERQLQYFKGDIFSRPGQDALQTQEGADPVYEVVNIMKKNNKPLPNITWVDEIAQACIDHIKDIGPKGKLGHIGSNGSDPGERIEKYGDWDVTMGENIDYGNSVVEDVVFSWLVDDGVADREHRNNLMETAFKVAGVAHGNHKEFGVCCVIAFAGGFRGKEGAKPRQSESKQPEPKQPEPRKGKGKAPPQQKELPAPGPENNLTQDEIEACKEAFDLFDGDSSGTIDPHEIEAALESLGDKKSTTFRLLAGIEELGADIDFESFLEHISGRLGNRSSRQGVERILDLFDDDGTGTINLKNMMRVARELGETMGQDELLGALKKISSNGKDITLDDFYKVMTRKINV